jgi:hypothetical protein
MYTRQKSGKLALIYTEIDALLFIANKTESLQITNKHFQILVQQHA